MINKKYNMSYSMVGMLKRGTLERNIKIFLMRCMGLSFKKIGAQFDLSKQRTSEIYNSMKNNLSI